jgi:hypothetical protein
VTQYEEERPVSGWAVGGITFAAVLMVMVGTFQALEGLAAIIDDEFYVVTKNYAFDLDVTAWGWIHLLLGIVIVLVGLGLFARQTWAGVTAIALAVLSAIANFFFVVYYPWWSLLVIAIDIWIIWALTRPGALGRSR